jgi:dolichol-phosphate mannosyltransferase
MMLPTPLPDAMNRYELSVVAPCYNEQEVLRTFYERVTQVCQAFGKTYELVLVNDGSRDDTWAIMRELAEQDPAVVAVDLSRNFGHQPALTAGLTLCRGQRAFILDADLQDPPELLEKFWAAMDEQQADVVYGKREEREGESAFKLATASAFYRVINTLSEVPIPSDTGDFRLMSRRAIDALLSMPERHRFIRGMVSWVGFKQVAYKYDRAARAAGETKYPLLKMVRFAADAITSFSTRPLRLATYLGFFASVCAVLMTLYTLLSWLFSGKLVAGWASLMVVVLFLGGVQLLVIGVLGEYIGRLYEQSKQRPLFLIRDVMRK